MFSRLATLETAVESLETGQLDDELRLKAAHEAHKLAGSLGTFGLASTSAMSSKIETFLVDSASVASNTAELKSLIELIKTAISSRKPSASS